MLLDVDKLETADLVASGAVFVVFFIAFLADKKGETRVWQLVVSAATGLLGLGVLLVPRQTLGYMIEGEYDAFHLWLGQGLATMFICFSLMTFQQCRAKSTDRQVRGGWLLSRGLGLTFVLVNGICNKLTTGKEGLQFSNQRVSFGMLAFGLVGIGSIVKMFQHYGRNDGEAPTTSKRSSGSVLNRHILFNTLTSVPSVVFYTTAPQFTFRLLTNAEGDSVHVHFLRLIGMYGILYIFQAITALHYENEEDKKIFITGNIIFNVMVLAVQLLNRTLMTTDCFYAFMVFAGVQLTNDACAILITFKQKRLQKSD